MVDLGTIAQATQALYYGYKLSKELYDEYLNDSTVIFENEKISFEFNIIIRFKRGFQPKIVDVENKLRRYLSELNFDPRTNIIKIKRNNVEYELIVFYWMYTQQIPDFDALDEEEEIEEDEIINENFVNDLTLCLIPKIVNLDKEHKGKVLFIAKDILEEIGRKIQENFNILPWTIKLNIKSNSKLVLKKLLKEIEDKIEGTSAQHSEPEENIEGEVVVSVWNLDAAYIDALNKVVFKKKSILNRLIGGMKLGKSL